MSTTTSCGSSRCVFRAATTGRLSERRPPQITVLCHPPITPTVVQPAPCSLPRQNSGVEKEARQSVRYQGTVQYTSTLITHRHFRVDARDAPLVRDADGHPTSTRAHGVYSATARAFSLRQHSGVEATRSRSPRRLRHPMHPAHHAPWGARLHLAASQYASSDARLSWVSGP